MRRSRATRAAGWAAAALLAAACGSDAGKGLGIAEERVPPDEAETIRGLIEVTKRVSAERMEAAAARRARGWVPVKRFNQPRHPGCLKGEFRIEPGLDDDLAVGLFATPASYPAWVRFANASDEPDTEKDFRGMSIKVMGVPGPKLAGPGGSVDLVLNSHPVLFVGTPADFLAFAEASGPLRFFLTHWKAFRIALAGRRHHPSHLTIQYWSTTPYLHGEGRAVKYSARPCGGVEDEEVEDPQGSYLQEAMRRQIDAGGACFDFLVQLQTDPEAMPIEDAQVEWDEEQSPFRKVATLELPKQLFVSRTREEFCENLAFNPWQTLAEHRPLGGLNRARRELYDELAAFRHAKNGVTYTEPTGAEPF